LNFNDKINIDGQLADDDSRAIPVHVVRPMDWPNLRARLGDRAGIFTDRASFAAETGQTVRVLDSDGALDAVIIGLGAEGGVMSLRGQAASLPSGRYAFESLPSDLNETDAALAWALGAYRFDRYRAQRPVAARLDPLPEARARLDIMSAACAQTRDMINTPANDMGPAEIEAHARDLAQRYGATLEVVLGQALELDYPAIHAVGRAATADRAPRMMEMQWGQSDAPIVALIGKGVVFDSGGLDIKPSAGMRWMKKDMGGAAHALGLASMIMGLALPLRLVVLLPVVENAISGGAMRPGDVLQSRKGLTIEVGNTDAEGRLILADALTRAAELSPVLTIDLATLTGAARVALGPEVTPFYTDDETMASELEAAGRAVEDPLWRMPLWQGYAGALDSDLADIKNDADAWAQAGSVTAALFLKRFAPEGSWVHFDLFAWNSRARPGWPQGAEVQAIRALLAVLEARYR